jgi:hypothetical protein
MKEEHNFSTPRNLYEKLLRESERFDNEPSGDNFFNFIVTAVHLKEWVKKAPISTHEGAKRMLDKISKNELMKQCAECVSGSSSYVFSVDKANGTVELLINGEPKDPYLVKNEILDMFRNYFEIK